MHKQSPNSSTSQQTTPFTKLGRICCIALFATSVISGLSGCGGSTPVIGGGSPITLTQENLDKVQKDMSTAQVKAILGEPTDSKSEPIPIVGGNKTTLTWENKTDHVVIVLKNDNVQTKEGHFGAPAQ